MNERDEFFGKFDDREKVDKKARELSKLTPDVEYKVYEQIWMCCTPGVKE